MKKMMTLVMMMTIAISANAFTYAEARNEALFLTDKMARELRLMPAQYDAVYDINLAYLRSVNPHSNAFGRNWEHRNYMLRNVLTTRQYDRFLRMEHILRPVAARPVPRHGHGPVVRPVPAPRHGHSNHPAIRRK